MNFTEEYPPEKSDSNEPSMENSSPGSDGLLKRCGSCHAVGYAEDIYCVRCGKLFDPICPTCGTPIRHPVAFYCVRCGEKLHDAPHIHHS